MLQTNSIRQTRTYWGVFDIREHDGEWIPRGWMCDCEEEGQRKLRWLRQWYPNAFLVEMSLKTVADNFHAPPLPLRSRATSKIQDEPIRQQEDPIHVQGLRLVK